MNFTILKNTKKGRLGLLETSHGTIKTPAFIFCATHGALKTVPSFLVSSPILLCNGFHLRNKVDDIHRLGGIHKFMNYNGVIITDSGGYQIMSMGYGSVSNEIKGVRIRKSFIKSIKEEGIKFQNPQNGDIEYFDAERSIEVQCKLGVDLVVSFDECTVSSHEYDYVKSSMLRSQRWGVRSKQAFDKFNNGQQGLYGIVQGGTYKDLRDSSVEFNKMNDFFGVAIGGSLGRTFDEMYDIVKYTAEQTRVLNRPTHLLGIGRRLEDLVPLGIDTFDFVEPTRIARHGIALKFDANLDLRKVVFVMDYSPIDENCLCMTCKNYTRAYLHYLIRINENSFMTLLTIHNMQHMMNRMEKIRLEIENSD